MSFSAYALLIANINWYRRLFCLYGQGTAVDVILAVRLCLPFIWTFSRLSFPSFVCFLFTPPVVLCHNKVSYIPSSDSFLILLSLWLILLFVFPLHHLFPPPPRKVHGRSRDGKRGLLFSSVWCGFGRVCAWFFWARGACFRKYVRRGVSKLCDVSHISPLMQICEFCVLYKLQFVCFRIHGCSLRGGGRESCADSQTPLPPDCRKKY